MSPSNDRSQRQREHGKRLASDASRMHIERSPWSALSERDSLMRFHICTEQGVHPRLVAGTLLFKPLNDVGIDPKRKKRLFRYGLQAFTRDGARKHLRSPLRRLA